MVIAKIQKLGTTLWEHKKKSLLGVTLLAWAGQWVRRKQRNNEIRTQYAKEALKFGEQLISAEDKCRRVFVLANVGANERSCYDDFTSNALPLLHLAGIQVNIVKADNEAQLEALAGAVDHEEADAVYIVGGDATVGIVLTGMLKKRDQIILPIGIFPGGYDNLTLKRLVPEVFTNEKDIQRQCESAMAIIEDLRRSVRPFKVEIDGNSEKPLFSIGDVGVGWFRHIEERRRKLWYFGSAKRRWAYIWEMLKRSPDDMEISFEWEEYCPGCNKCRAPPAPVIVQWRWWHMFTGTPRYAQKEKERDFSNVENEKCGTIGAGTVKGTELLISAEQQYNDERTGLRLQAGRASLGRLGVIREGWSRCAADVVHRSVEEGFYTADVFARAFVLQFTKLPEFVRRVYVSSDEIKNPIEEGRTLVHMKALDSKIELFLPTRLRAEPNP
ncbi:unnamed protein product, partial [Mesorhabditis belari]|uniref:DAGKc domain-containing protein n=1 Tax=Mesorhabditis belari TaxID=2138241 RepID=A0AAF3EYB5_9BILA